jgi:hypothetical protein
VKDTPKVLAAAETLVALDDPTYVAQLLLVIGAYLERMPSLGTSEEFDTEVAMLKAYALLVHHFKLKPHTARQVA